MAGMADATSAHVNDGASSLSPPTNGFNFIAYAVISILGAIIWDIFSNLGEDYELIQRSSIGLPIIAYFLSRITTLLCFILMVRFSTAIGADCTTLLRATHWTFAFGLSLTTLLLVLRARAVYKNRKWTANFFAVMWFGVVAASLVETQLGSLGMRQESSGRCVIVSTIAPFIIATTIVPVANDIVLFCAITWKLIQNSHEELTIRKGLTIAVFGHHLPSFSKTLLRDGQAYFLTTVVVSITTISIFCIAPQTVAGYSVLLAFINIGVMHLMACKIYRKTRLGVRRPEIAVDSASSLGPMEFRLQVDSIAHFDGDNMVLELPAHLAHERAGNAGAEDLEQQKFVDADEEEVDVVEGKMISMSPALVSQGSSVNCI